MDLTYKLAQSLQQEATENGKSGKLIKDFARAIYNAKAPWADIPFVNQLLPTSIKQRVAELNDPIAMGSSLAFMGGLKFAPKGNVVSKLDDIFPKRPVALKDVWGDPVPLKPGEKITPHVMSDNKILLRDGDQYLVNKNQFENLRNQSIVKGKEFAPELKQVEEVVKQHNPPAYAGEELYTRGVEPRPTGTKFSQYTLPGGKNYKEVLIKAPPIEPRDIIAPNGRIIKGVPRTSFTSSHWDEPNVLAHLRMNDRVTPNGKKVLFLEELQSDWAAKGRKTGYIPENKDVLEARRIELENKGRNATQTEKQEWIDIKNKLKTAYVGVPSHPLLKDWQSLSLKRALKEAVDGDYEYLSWVSGKQTADRYDLSKYITDVNWTKHNNRTFSFDTKTKQGIDINKQNITKQELADTLGKEIAEKIDKADRVGGFVTADKYGRHGTIDNLDLKVGGEWATTLYDRQVPNLLKDLTGAKVELIKTPTNQQAIKITPEIRRLVKGGV